jgi:hypothetical protein
VPTSSTAASVDAARPIVAAALDALGGEAKLRAIRNLHVKTIGTWTSIESSSHPEPPWHRGYDHTDEWLDYERGAWRKDGVFSSIDAKGEQAFSVVAADGATALTLDGKTRPGSPVYLGDAAEHVLYQAHRLLIAAADAADLRRGNDDVLAGEPQHTVAFHHLGQPIRLWINARTRRLAAAEITHAMPDDAFWRVRGDVLDRLELLQWRLHPSGVWFAHQTDLIRNATPYHSYLTTLIEPDAAAPETFAIPDDIRAAYKVNAHGPGDVPLGEIGELAPGVWLVAHPRYNALVIAQPAGTIVIDAPISEVYVGRLLDDVARRFGKPAAQVVLTDQIIPTLSGLREVGARGIPLRALDTSADFVAGLLAARHTLAPDALARSSRSVKVKLIATRKRLGDGATRLELIPMRTTLGERAVLAWLPGARLLWVATALTVDGEGHANPSRLAELEAVVAREHLNVDRVVGSGLASTSWASLQPPARARAGS